MKTAIVVCIAVASGALGAVMALPVQDAQSKSQDGKAPAGMSAQDEAWMKAATPGPVHRAMAEMVGTWKTDITMMEPGKPPTKSSGEDTYTLMFDGRYLVQDSNSEMMGMPFKGHGIYAYDNASKKHQFCWLDNMGTGIMCGKGDMDEASKTVTYQAEMTNPMDGALMPCRITMTHVSKDECLFKMYCTQQGQEAQMMEIKYTRKA